MNTKETFWKLTVSLNQFVLPKTTDHDLKLKRPEY